MCKLILEAMRRSENPKPIALTFNDKKNLKDTLFLQFKFHKNGIARQKNRAEFEKITGSICTDKLGIT